MRKRVRPRTLEVGGVSHGTMREHDLIPEFLSVARDLRLTREERATVRAIDRRATDGEDEDSPYFHSDTAAEDLDTLFDLLDAHSPDYCYFGANEGDGSDYGCWPCIDRLDEEARGGEVLKIEAGSTWPGRKELRERGIEYVAEITDHGNVSFFSVRNARQPLWDCV